MNRDADRTVYEFNEFRLEGAQRRLLQNGKPVSLKPKILDLLLFLVRMRGQLVEKNDLMREIWPNSIVEETNITVSISMLRKILGEDRLQRQFIETVPRRGYRFVAEVTEIPAEQTARQDSRQTSAREVFEKDLPINSLAVLPMKTTSQNVTVEYLTEGITESIINTLSQTPKLRVVACSMVFRFKGKDIDPQEVGMLLNVRAVMLVRVIPLDEELIIRSELVRVSDGSLIWGGQYNRTASDLLVIQAEIAKDISEVYVNRLSFI